MKAVIFSALLFAMPVQAWNLLPSPCTGTQVCTNPANDAGLDVDYVSVSGYYGRVLLSVAGVVYDSGPKAILPTGYTNISNLTLYALDGSSVIVNLAFTHWVTLNRSGHNYYVQHYYLDGGTVEGIAVAEPAGTCNESCHGR